MAKSKKKQGGNVAVEEETLEAVIEEEEELVEEEETNETEEEKPKRGKRRNILHREDVYESLEEAKKVPPVYEDKNEIVDQYRIYKIMGEDEEHFFAWGRNDMEAIYHVASSEGFKSEVAEPKTRGPRGINIDKAILKMCRAFKKSGQEKMIELTLQALEEEKPGVTEMILETLEKEEKKEAA